MDKLTRNQQIENALREIAAHACAKGGEWASEVAFGGIETAERAPQLATSLSSAEEKVRSLREVAVLALEQYRPVYDGVPGRGGVRQPDPEWVCKLRLALTSSDAARGNERGGVDGEETEGH